MAIRAPYTYYGYRAAERLAAIDVPAASKANITINEIPDAAVLDAAISEEPLTPTARRWTDAAVEALSANPSFKKSLELMQLDMKKEAAAELWSLQEKTPRKHGALLGLSKTFFELGDYYRSLIIILRNYERYLEGPARDKPEDLWLLAYPQGYWRAFLRTPKIRPRPLFCHGHHTGREPVSCRGPCPRQAPGGVMQVMPSTGEWWPRPSRCGGLTGPGCSSTTRASASGQRYLSYLMKRFKGDPILVAASYNAGPEAVSMAREKRERRGSGRVCREHPLFRDQGIREKVLRNYAEYKRIYGRAGVTSMPAPPRNGEGAEQAVREEQPKAP